MPTRRSERPPSAAKRFYFGRVFPAGFVLIGAVVTIWGLSTLADAEDSATWPGVRGIVVRSDVDHSPASRTRMGERVPEHFTPHVHYEFSVDGKKYVGTRINFDAGYRTRDKVEAQRYVERYRKGNRVYVYYDPEGPARCVLEPGTPTTAWGPAIVGGVFVLAGVLGLIYLPRVIDAGHVRIR